jgi:hypothetical protein
MEAVPLCRSEGLVAILEAAKNEDCRIRLVAVNSSSNGYKDELKGNNGIICYYITLVRLAAMIPLSKEYMLSKECELLYYTAPRWTSHKYNRREEKIPVVPDPKAIYLVIDDSFDLGNTSFCATRGLVNQGVLRDNVWLHMPIISQGLVPKYPDDETISLDRAVKYFGYIHQYRWLDELTRPAAG